MSEILRGKRSASNSLIFLLLCYHSTSLCRIISGRGIFALLRTLLHVTVSLIFFGHRVLWRDPSSINPFCQKDHRRFHYLLQQLGRLPRFNPAGCCRDCDRVQRRPKHLTNSPNSWRVIVRTNNISRVAHRVHKYAAKMLKNIDDLTRIRTRISGSGS